MIAAFGLVGLIGCGLWNLRNPQRLGAIFTMLAIQQAHGLLFAGNDPLIYFAGAAACDAIIIVALGFFSASTALRDIQWINALAILVHAGGFAGYWLRVNPAWYTYTIGILSAAQMIRLLIKDEGNAAGVDSRGDMVCGPDRSNLPVSQRGRR